MKKFLAVLLLMLGMTNFCWAQENAQTGENAKMHEFMLKAVAEAEKNIISKDGGPFGAVIVKDGVIVGTGHNDNDPTCHAEMQAIRDACRNLKTFDLTGCELYTSCYPCPMCLSATIWANIKKVYYGNTAEDAADIGFRDDFIYKFIEGGCKDVQVLDLEQQFAEQTEKTIY